MDPNTDVSTIRTEPVPHEKDVGEVLHTDVAIEYSDNTDEFLTDYYKCNQITGVDTMRNSDDSYRRVEPVFSRKEANSKTRIENGKADKRERAINFTPEECEKLLKIVSRYKNVVEDKKSDLLCWRRKEATWKRVEAEFNASSSTYRSSKALKIKYDGFKRAVRKKSTLIRSGEGASSVAHLDATETMVIDIICLDAQGTMNCAEGDGESLDNPTANFHPPEDEVQSTPCRPAAKVPRFPSTSTVSPSPVQHHNDNTGQSSVIEEAPDKPAPDSSATSRFNNTNGTERQQRDGVKISKLIAPPHAPSSQSGALLNERRNLIRLQRKLLLEERAEKIKDYRGKEMERRERILERRENEMQRRENRKDRAFREQERVKLNRILALKEEYLLEKLKIIQANK